MLARAWSDPRILRLAELCGEPLPHIVGHLEALWSKAYEHLPRSGYINKADMPYLELWAMWDGVTGKFAHNLLRTGLLVRRGKRGYCIHAYEKNVPEFVRKRWLRKDLEKIGAAGFEGEKCPDVVRTLSGQRRLTRQDKTRQDKASQGETCAEKTRQDKPGGAPAGPASPAKSSHLKIAAVGTTAVVAEKALPVSALASDQVVCSVVAKRIKDLLAQVPKVDVLFILNAAGLANMKALEIKRRHGESDVRWACHYAAANAKKNLAGLLLSALEHPEWR